MEIHFACSGNNFLAIIDQDGQQDVAINGSFSGTSSKKSFASSTVHRSAPTATSLTSVKPSAWNAPRILLFSIPGNWPAMAGATIAYTGVSLFNAITVWKICPLSTIALNGQLTRHWPQDTHLSWSISALPYSSEPMAFMPQAFEQGRSCLMIALYGQASRHFPHLMQASSSICDLPPSICTAFFGQTSTQGCSRQPWQPSVIITLFSGQELQANLITLISGGS